MENQQTKNVKCTKYIQVIQFFLNTLSAPVLDDSTVSQLCEMGFPLEACRKAVYYTGNTGIDAAMNWIMSHMDDSGEKSSGNLPESKLSMSLTAPLTLYVLLLSDWLQTSRPPWCCQAAAPAPGPHPLKVSLRSTWQPSSAWASAETRQPKHFEPRLESNSVQLEISRATSLKVELCQYRHSCSCFYSGTNKAKFFLQSWRP